MSEKSANGEFVSAGRDPAFAPAPAIFTGSSGRQRCDPWCRHFQPLGPPYPDSAGICLHPLSVCHGWPVSRDFECTVGEPQPDEE